MKILLLNQCFYPDVVSTAQHTKDLALALAERGHEVTAIAGSRGYDNPELRFPARETWKGIRIIRIASLATGKSSKLRRALNFGSFFVSCFFRLLTMPRFDVVVALTSPPLISAPPDFPPPLNATTPSTVATKFAMTYGRPSCTGNLSGPTIVDRRSGSGTRSPDTPSKSTSKGLIAPPRSIGVAVDDPTESLMIIITPGGSAL